MCIFGPLFNGSAATSHAATALRKNLLMYIRWKNMTNRGLYSTWGTESGRVALGREHKSDSLTFLLENIRASSESWKLVQ